VLRVLHDWLPPGPVRISDTRLNLDLGRGDNFVGLGTLSISSPQGRSLSLKKWLWVGMVGSLVVGLSTFLTMLLWSPFRRGLVWAFVENCFSSPWVGWAWIGGAVGFLGCLWGLVRVERREVAAVHQPSPDGDFVECPHCQSRIERGRVRCAICGESSGTAMRGRRTILLGVVLLLVATLVSFGSCASGSEPMHAWWLLGALLGCNGMILALVVVVIGKIRKG
jgi:hypothetical protein